jgi:hypothetical protein
MSDRIVANFGSQAPNDPDADKIVYTGPDSRDNDRNRIESGCQVNLPRSSSVCTSFPFSQAFSDKLADWQCDEWPPAASQQPAFRTKQSRIVYDVCQARKMVLSEANSRASLEGTAWLETTSSGSISLRTSGWPINRRFPIASDKAPLCAIR